MQIDTNTSIKSFNEQEVIHKLKHYLPSQAPLKDFVHHNTLHAYQHQKFGKGIRNAAKTFGYNVSLSLTEYRSLYSKKRIRQDVLKSVIKEYKEEKFAQDWEEKLLTHEYNEFNPQKLGNIRKHWKSHYHLDLDTIVHTNLFRILNSYLDQGISIAKFPMISEKGFIASLRALDTYSYVSFFKTTRGKKLLHSDDITIESLLDELVGDRKYYEQYLMDQQFAHPGWSGMVAIIESQPISLLDSRKITLEELIKVELILEIDNVENTLKKKWKPLSKVVDLEYHDLFEDEPLTELEEVLSLWQQAFEWSFYDEVLSGIQLCENKPEIVKKPSFQAFFCIDDRECSIRRHIEHFDSDCETFGTPGHFGVDAYYQPKLAQYYTKICPAPITPKHLLQEVITSRENKRDIHFNKSSHSLITGFLISQSLGFWSALKLMGNLFKPSLSPATSSSFAHMQSYSGLTVENRSSEHQYEGLQIGYTIEEMADRVEGVLKSTGLVSNFADIIYIIGHGASSTNNTHYAGYDCGACSGRPGSANARAFCYMANHRAVREILATKNLKIPEKTEFVGGLHDTTRDEFMFYDEDLLSPEHQKSHVKDLVVFYKALEINAKERSRRFKSINSKSEAKKVHKKVKLRSVSLFEPRPELNHATNALCVIGRKHINDHLFLDRRSFLNSYNYKNDPSGKHLLNILNAAVPVCGGINLEYYFSRVDNERLGAGSKLPHNVMGLIGVANGFEGDLKTGLPIQMVEVHDPLRLLMIVEHYPEVVMKTIKENKSTYEWIENEWIMLAVVHPESNKIYKFKNGEMVEYFPLKKSLKKISDLNKIFESSEENLPVYQLS